MRRAILRGMRKHMLRNDVAHGARCIPFQGIGPRFYPLAHRLYRAAVAAGTASSR
jgi:hypothetical protein